MGAKITLNGNLGDDPRCGVTTGRNNEPLHWISFSMRQPHWSKNDRDQFVDSGGFWMNVSWFDKKAETVGRLLKKGAAVLVTGDLHVETWADPKTGELKAAFKVNADEVCFDMRSLADVTYRQRSAERGPQPQPNIGNSGHPGNAAPAVMADGGNDHPAADGFEDMPPDFMGEAPPQGETAAPAAHPHPAGKKGDKNGNKAGAVASATANNSPFPTDDDRPI